MVLKEGPVETNSLPTNFQSFGTLLDLLRGVRVIEQPARLVATLCDVLESCFVFGPIASRLVVRILQALQKLLTAAIEEKGAWWHIYFMI